MPDSQSSFLALDVGSVRIGVALANHQARIAHPAGVINNDELAITKLAELCKTEKVSEIIVGLPRNLDGQETTQTRLVRFFADDLSKKINLQIIFQDEALTSLQAEKELKSKKKSYSKGDVDSLAATLILEDYLSGKI